MTGKLEYISPTIQECKKDKIAAFLGENGFIKTIWYLVDKVWDEKTVSEADRVLKTRDENHPLYQLLFKEYNAEEHFRQVDSHKEWIIKAYERLKDYVPNMTMEDARQHDQSKYDFVQVVGYTAKWVHNVDWNNETWQASLNDHYRRERHHPEFYPKGQRMPRKYLEESLIDMVASRWERQLKGNGKVSNSELVGFDCKYLLRYCEGDIENVQALINKIIQDDYIENQTSK
ncbi:uncharacterized protein LOC117342850 [Pecten maximus]|uniref:uncharacterized protein LOC117342850 n=1 Tax=Pecten maximus TaxID=6579 RepID=UPI001457F38F|nr:uncharacterized protein LOC117342850 [Pecten maximus]XP_033761017.1 uncharacterized protein LOC117342850 [Pecten maximus]